jgi:hypothetical protein
MGLVAVAQAKSQLRLFDGAAGELLRRFMQPIALNHPLGADPDVLREEPLERPRVRAVAGSQVGRDGSRVT